MRNLLMIIGLVCSFFMSNIANAEEVDASKIQEKVIERIEALTEKVENMRTPAFQDLDEEIMELEDYRDKVDEQYEIMISVNRRLVALHLAVLRSEISGKIMEFHKIQLDDLMKQLDELWEVVK